MSDDDRLEVLTKRYELALADDDLLGTHLAGYYARRELEEGHPVLSRAWRGEEGAWWTQSGANDPVKVEPQQGKQRKADRDSKPDNALAQGSLFS